MRTIAVSTVAACSCASLQFSEARSLNATEACSRVVDSVDSLLNTRSKFIDDPVAHKDLNQLRRICEYWTFLCLRTDQMSVSRPSISSDLLRLWKIIDILLDSSLTFTNVEDFSRYVSCQSYPPAECDDFKVLSVVPSTRTERNSGSEHVCSSGTVHITPTEMNRTDLNRSTRDAQLRTVQRTLH